MKWLYTGILAIILKMVRSLQGLQKLLNELDSLSESEIEIFCQKAAQLTMKSDEQQITDFLTGCFQPQISLTVIQSFAALNPDSFWIFCKITDDFIKRYKLKEYEQLATILTASLYCRAKKIERERFFYVVMREAEGLFVVPEQLDQEQLLELAKRLNDISRIARNFVTDDRGPVIEIFAEALIDALVVTLETAETEEQEKDALTNSFVHTLSELEDFTSTMIALTGVGRVAISNLTPFFKDQTFVALLGNDPETDSMAVAFLQEVARMLQEENHDVTLEDLKVFASGIRDLKNDGPSIKEIEDALIAAAMPLCEKEDDPVQMAQAFFYSHR